MLRIFWNSAMNAFPGKKPLAVPPRRGEPSSASWATPSVEAHSKDNPACHPDKGEHEPSGVSMKKPKKEFRCRENNRHIAKEQKPE
jgi:hypothetical protein